METIRKKKNWKETDVLVLNTKTGSENRKPKTRNRKRSACLFNGWFDGQMDGVDSIVIEIWLNRENRRETNCKDFPSAIGLCLFEMLRFSATEIKSTSIFFYLTHHKMPKMRI